MWHNGRIIKAHYCHNLHWLQCWSTVGVKYCSDGTLHFYVNGQDQGVAAHDISGVSRIFTIRRWKLRIIVVVRYYFVVP